MRNMDAKSIHFQKELDTKFAQFNAKFTHLQKESDKIFYYLK